MKSKNDISLKGSPNHLYFNGDCVDIEVLGGISLHALNRLRVTLKITADYRKLRLSLDLYHDEQVDRLIRKVAERLEVKTKAFETDISNLTDALENYRFQQIEGEKLDNEETILSDEEKESAEKYLSEPNLIERTQTDLEQAGIIGEEINRLLMYLIFTTRKQDHPLHVISLGESGMGKTYLQEKISGLIPPEDQLQITALSENAFYYFKPQELNHKLLLIEDLDGAESSLYPLRELQSKGRISKTVVQKDASGTLRTAHLKVNGPVSIGAATTKSRIYEDNADRCFLIQPDESEAQSDRIQGYQKKLSAGKINLHAQRKVVKLLQNCQRVLEPIKVVNPYAEYLSIPKSVLKPRRTNAHYLHFIAAVTFYHQYQREKKTDTQSGESFIETTPEDIKIAHSLLKEVLLAKADELSRACRTYFEKVKDNLKAEQTDTFKSQKIRGLFRINPNTQRRHMAELLRYGYIEKIGGDQRNGFIYQISDQDNYQDLQSEVFTHLESIVEAVCCSKAVHMGNEQLNPLSLLEKGQVVQLFTPKKETTIKSDES